MLLTDNTFFITLFAGILVQTGVALKNAGDQLKLPGKMSTILGTILFVLGWLGVAVSIGFSDGQLSMKTLLAILSSFGIVAAVMITKALNIPKVGGPIFIGSWLLLGITIGMGRIMSGKIMGIFASLLVIGSMTVLLPMQRKKKVVDLPGYSMFSSAWFLIAIANALVNPTSIGLKALS